MRIGVKDFAKRPAGYLSDSAKPGSEAIEVTLYNRDHATLVATRRWHQAQRAEDLVTGLLRLAQRGADCAEYQAYAEALDQMTRTGNVDIRQPDDDEAPQHAA